MTPILVKSVVALLLLVSAAAAQTTVPDLSRIFEQSKAYQVPALRDGCRMRYDRDLPGIACSKELLVTLSPAKSTTVTNTAVKSNSHVSCGCSNTGSTTLKCNERARWLARFSVESVTNGSFILKHSFASGDEQVVCEIG